MTTDTFTEEFLDGRDERFPGGKRERGECEVGGLETAGKRRGVVGLGEGDFGGG